jgi:hypothetical protein
MLCEHTAAVNRKWTGRINPDDASPRRHDGVHRCRLGAPAHFVDLSAHELSDR